MPRISPNVFKTISLLKPYDIDLAKVYIGKLRDGGYVLADSQTRSDVLSFGVGPETSFEKAMAEQGRQVFLADHTVWDTPEHHPLFSFERVGVSAEGVRSAELAPLTYHLEKIAGKTSCVLKMDVEGAEWDVFSSIDASVLDRFEQIVFEGHWLSRLCEPAFCEKVFLSLNRLNDRFTLFHVHANNCAGLHFVEGFPVADVLELSYVRTDLVKRQSSQTYYPCVNQANHPHHADHPLLFYPFLPESDVLSVSNVVNRICAEDDSTQRKLLAGEDVPY
ncbi:FkbM family methyltransferase [Beijerinckia sp. L45]|uniref:FkbM family methyltransferase n=1 Tax=Beijerinckia sp. L45 TaxID=1641855 RepID=UPI00131B3B22|nr:FkbM family methyltransferase [Beijerinckia sp. L45]